MTSPPPEWGPGAPPPQPPPGGEPGPDSVPRHRHRLEPDTGLRAGVTVRRLIAPVVAVLAVVALVGALLFIGHRPVSHGQTAAVSQDIRGSTPASNSFGPSPGASKAPAASPGASSPATQPERARSRAARRHAVSAQHHAAARQPVAATAPPAVVPVTVLNNSRIQGLAHHVAAELAERGWPIAQVGNYTGRLPQTTLFYVNGQQPVAGRLADEFPGFAGVAQVEPRPAGLPRAGLTLVLTRYWQS